MTGQLLVRREIASGREELLSPPSFTPQPSFFRHLPWKESAPEQAGGGWLSGAAAHTGNALPPALLLMLQGSVLQCGFVLCAALLFWSFRSDESEGMYGYISY